MNEIMNEMNGGNIWDGKDFDMQQLMNLCGQNMMTVNNLSRQMGLVANKVDSLDKCMTMLVDRVDGIELRSEIDSDQEERLRETVNKRVYEILHYDPLEIAKYSRRFFSRCWSDAKRDAGVAASYKATKKENYQRAIDYIEAWFPREGCTAFKDKIDEAAKAKRKALDEGYSN